MMLLLYFVFVPEAAAEREIQFEIERESTPRQLPAGGLVPIKITLRNMGQQSWSEAAGDRLSYHWRSPDGKMLERDGKRTLFPHEVASGESIELRAMLRVPEEAGRYQLQWRMVRENVRWYPEPLRGESPRIEVEVVAANYDWAVHEAELPEKVGGDDTFTVPVRIENLGTTAWSPQTFDRLAYHWWNEAGEVEVFEGRRSELPGEIAPGESAQVSMKVVAPHRAGRYRLEFAALREGAMWYPKPRGETEAAEERWIEVTEPTLTWAIVRAEDPGNLAAEAERELKVVVTNTGVERWGEDDHLSYHWLDESGATVEEGLRTVLPRPIEAGESVTLNAKLRAPEREGRYVLKWEMVREHVRWFGAPADGKAEGTVEVGAPSLAWELLSVDDLPPIWANGRSKVELELRNVGSETWSSERGDHLSYHWLRDLPGGETELVHFDGLRSQLPEEVAPGASVRLTATIQGPRHPGDYRLEWEMVREHVRWYGPALAVRSEESQRARVSVLWYAALYQCGLAIALLAIALGWRWKGPKGVVGERLTEVVFSVMLWLTVVSIVSAFSELSGLPFWKKGFVYSLSGAICFIVPLFFLRGRVRLLVAVILAVALSLLLFADLIYMHFFGSILPVVALTASHHVGEVGASIRALVEPSYFWLFPPAVGWLLLAALWPSAKKSQRGAAVRRRWERPVALSLCLLAVSPFAWRLGTAMSGELGQRVFSEQRNVGRLGVLNAHIFDFVRVLREWGRRGVVDEEERAEIGAYFDARQEKVAAEVAKAEGAKSSFGRAKGTNLLLIQVEAAQEFVVGAVVNDQEITPFLNRLRGEALYYPNVVDQTAQGKTSDGEYATLNSQHPLGEGALCFLRADNNFYSLAHILKEQGYQTMSSHPYKRGFWNRAVLHPRYGFDSSTFRRELGPGQEVGWGLSDGLFFERSLKRVRELPEPWFAFWITLSLHHPYDDFPDDLKVLDLGELEGSYFGNYLHAMHYFDRSLKALFEALEQDGLSERTIVAFYGDHDARFELDEVPAVLEVAGLSGWSPSAFHQLERVPFFVVLPEEMRGRERGVVETLGGQVDIAPTLLHYLGIDRPRAFIGKPLLQRGEKDGFAAYPDGSAFGDDMLFISEGRDIPRRGGCFDYPSGHTRPRKDCDALEARADEELGFSRTVVDHDLHRWLGAE